MRLRILLSTLLLMISSLAFAPSLYACESCWAANTKDPSGGYSSKVRCYTWDKGMWEICTVLEDYSGCDTSDTDPTACPISSGDNGGTGGGGGTGGSTCDTSATGACPPDCWDCGGGGMLY